MLEFLKLTNYNIETLKKDRYCEEIFRLRFRK